MHVTLLRIRNTPNAWTRNGLLEYGLADLPDLDIPTELLAPLFDADLPFLAPAVERLGIRDSLVVIVQGLHLHAFGGLGPSCSQIEDDRFLVPFEDERIARECVESALRLLARLVEHSPPKWDWEIQVVKEIADRICMGPTSRAVIAVARKRGIPVRFFPNSRLLQLGHGANQKRIRRSETTLTTALAKALSSEKELTCALLRSAGLPVPAGSVVANAEEAWSKAEELGLPVVVKPKDSCQSRGVFLGLRSRTEVLVAFEQARAEGSAVLVEKFVPGVEHRLLVVGNRVAAACRGDPAQVVGDGVHAIRNLIEVQINSDPRRGEHAAAPLDPLTVDSSMLLLLQQQGYTPESVPMTGAEVLVRRNGNLAVDVTERVHPAVAASVLKAVHLVGLDVAGVDVVAEDIGRPLEEQGGCILEVNGGPGLQMHLQPGQGTAQPVIEIILDSLFPDVELARVPIVALVGDVPNALGFRLAEALQTRFGHVAWSSSEGLFLNQSLLKAGDLRDPAGVDMALLHPQVEAAVLELSRRGLLEESLGFDRAEVVVWMGGGERSLVEAVLRTARNGWILGNADAPEVVVRLADEPGKCVLFSLSEKPIEVGSAAPNVVTVWREGDCGILQRAGERRAFPIVGGFLESLTLECLRNSP